MNSLKQEQRMVSETAKTDKGYEWSYVQVAEEVVTTVVSAAIIGGAGIFLGLVYAGWTLLLNVWRAPAGLIGILAFVLLGAVLIVIILGVVIVAWFRRMSSAAFV